MTGQKQFGLSSYDGAQYVTVQEVSTTTGGHTGTGLVRLDAIAGGSPSMQATGGYIGEMYVAMGPAPGYAGGSGMQLSLNGVEIELTYIEIIETAP